MFLKLIGCKILYRELCHVAAHSVNKVDIEFVTKGLHDMESADMSARLQDVIDRSSGSEEAYDYILLGYALCNNGTAGLEARSVPLVIPRAHDCITLFMGSRERYSEYFDAHPGTYFYTSGWIERDESSEDVREFSIQRKTGMDSSYEDFVKKYGEDNAAYLYETLCMQTNNYEQLTYIEMGLGPSAEFEEYSRKMAAEKSWKFDKIKGDISYLRRLVDGDWNNVDFLVVPPGHKIKSLYDGDIMGVE